MAGILKKVQHDGDDSTDAIQRPRSTHTVHQRIDDGSHSISLRSGKLSACKTVSLVEQ